MLFSFRQFLYWHKRNGGGGWSVAFFCCYAVCWLGSLAVEQSGTGNVPNAWGALPQKI